MPTPRTSPLGYILPRGGDKAEISKINDYFTQLVNDDVYTNRCMIAPLYDPSRTEPYMEGDIVQYERVAYRCLEDNVSGNWDATKWEQTTLGDEIATKGGGSAEVTKEASGNPIELSDAASAPLVECKTEIQGSQDLHGYDKPWVGGAGKNKLMDSGYVQGVLGWNETTANSIVANAYFITSPYMPINNNTAYTLSAIHGNIVRIYVTDENHNTLYFRGNNPIEGNNVLIPATSGAVYCRVSIGINDESVIPSDYGTKVYGQLEIGSTATSYEPYSNICPITAYTENTISEGGKNLFGFNKTFIDKTAEYRASSSQRLNIVGNSDNSITCSYNNGTWSFGYLEFTGIDGTQDYTISFKVKDNNTSFTPSIGIGAESDSTKLVIVVNGGNGTTSATTSEHFTLYDLQVERGTAETDYVPFVAHTTHTTTFPSAIYRGSEDVVNGEVTSGMPVIDLGDLTWSAYTTDTTGHSFYVNVPTGTKTVSDDSSVANLVCEIYETVAFINPSEWLRRNAIICQVPNAQRWIVRDERYSDATSFASAMSGVKLAYELATPTTSSVTPTNLPIKSLSGYNHIESSTGDMEVEYITEEFQPLVDLIEESGRNGHTYSTQEQVVGKWIDGSDVYEKVIDLGSVITYEEGWNNVIPHESYYDKILNGVAINPDGIMYPVFIAVNGTTYMELFTYRRIYVQYIVIRYTKTTTTRSLNASLNTQKAQIEPLTDKTEEVPTEEEKAVNDAINEQKEEEQR